MSRLLSRIDCKWLCSPERKYGRYNINVKIGKIPNSKAFTFHFYPLKLIEKYQFVNTRYDMILNPSVVDGVCLSRIQIFLPESRTRIKEFKYFWPHKIVHKLPAFSSPDPGSRGKKKDRIPDPQYCLTRELTSAIFTKEIHNPQRSLPCRLVKVFLYCHFCVKCKGQWARLYCKSYYKISDSDPQYGLDPAFLPMRIKG